MLYWILPKTKSILFILILNYAIKTACTDLERVFGNVFFKRYNENMVNVYWKHGKCLLKHSECL